MMRKFKILLWAGLIMISSLSCRNWQKYFTIVEVKIPTSDVVDDLYRIAVNTESVDGTQLDLFNSVYSLFPEDYGTTVDVVIAWEEFEDINPRFQKVIFFVESYDNSRAASWDRDPTVVEFESKPKKLQPGKIYSWDPVNSDEIEYTGERDSKIDESPYCYVDTFSGDGNRYTFNEDGTFSLAITDLNGVCDPAVSRGTYSISGGSITFNFSSLTICGESVSPPPTETASFSCSLDGISVNGSFRARQ